MAVYFDDMTTPTFVAPLALNTVLALGNGTESNAEAYIGFTGATGLRQWQIHEIYNIRFCGIFGQDGSKTCIGLE